MKIIGLLLVIGLLCGMTGISGAGKPNPAIDNTVILCAGYEVEINSNPESPVCVGTTVQFSIKLPCGWTFVSACWTFSGGTPGTGSGATPSTTYNSPGEDYAVTMTGMAKDQCGQSRSISGAMTITVFEVEKITVDPARAAVIVGKSQEFTATALDTEGNDVTEYIADKIQWSTKGEGKEDIGDINPPKTGSTITFIAREELPAGKNKLTGHVIAAFGGVRAQALVDVVDWDFTLEVRIIGSPHTRWEEVEEITIAIGKTAQFKARGDIRWWWYTFTWEGVDPTTIKSKKSSSTASKKYEAYGVYEAKVTVTPLWKWLYPGQVVPKTKKIKVIVKPFTVEIAKIVDFPQDEYYTKLNLAVIGIAEPVGETLKCCAIAANPGIVKPDSICKSIAKTSDKDWTKVVGTFFAEDSTLLGVIFKVEALYAGVAYDSVMHRVE